MCCSKRWAGFASLVVAILGFVAAPAVAGLNGYDEHINPAAVRQTLLDSVDLWNSGLAGRTGFGVYDGAGGVNSAWDGFFQCNLQRDWTYDTGRDPDMTSISQSRAIYMNTEAGRWSTGSAAGRYAEIAKIGATYMAGKSYDTVHGGYFWGLDVDGDTPPNDDPANGTATDKDSYGQVHPVFALAHTYMATGDTTYLTEARQGWDDYNRNFADPGYAGAYKATQDRSYTTMYGHRNLDYMCHAFETQLAMYDAHLQAGQADQAAAIAGQVAATGNHIVNVMAQTATDGGKYIPWNYEADWTPVDKPWTDEWAPPSRVSTGHQFEFAWLLSRAVERGLGDESWVETGEDLMEFAFATDAYDPVTGAIVYDAIEYDGTVDYSGASRENRNQVTWWPQAELARALSHYAVVNGRTDLWDEYDLVADLIEQELIDQVYGGWFAKLDADTLDQSGDPDKGHIWKVNYHAAMLYSELARLETVPEPASMLLWVLGSMALLDRRRRA
jgi:mannose/cellobiose epimerase-like protein (N-acyl-D-glucosamine 2-epimerase family)